MIGIHFHIERRVDVDASAFMGDFSVAMHDEEVKIDLT